MVGVGHGSGDGEPQARTACPPGPVGVEPDEPIEDSITVSRIHSGTIVSDPEPNDAVGFSQLGRHRALGMADCILEARSAGLPVVASSRGGVGTFITDEFDGRLASSDVDMTQAMVKLLVDDDYRRAMTRNARATTPNLGWDTAVANSLNGYLGAARISGQAALTPKLALA